MASSTEDSTCRRQSDLRRKEEVVEGKKMDSDTSARLLWAGVGGIVWAGIARAIAPMGRGLAQAVLEGMVLIVVSLVIYRFMARRSSNDY